MIEVKIGSPPNTGLQAQGGAVTAPASGVFFQSEIFCAIDNFISSIGFAPNLQMNLYLPCLLSLPSAVVQTTTL